MSSLSTLPKGDSAWLLRKSIQRIMQQVSVLETNIGSSTTGNSANTQVIFNDAGTLRGDAGLTYNKTTDTLSTGSATITGDLTVDTSTLKVDSANNRVGIGTASPANQLSVRNEAASGIAVIDVRGGTGGAGSVQISGNGTTLSTSSFDLIQNSLGALIVQRDANPLSMLVNGSERYAISSSGVATWSNVGGVAGTAMTLNSTGLGIGMSPANNLSIGSATYASFGVKIDSITQSSLIFKGTPDAAGYEHAKIVSGRESSPFTYGSFLAFYTEGKNSGTTDTSVERLRIDSSGNVGIGVTSALSKLTVAGSNLTTASWGISSIYSTDSAAIDKGGSITFGGSFTGTTVTYFAQISGRKENSTDSDVAGYLALSSRPTGGLTTDRMRVKSNGQIRFIPLAADPTGAEAGDVYYNSTSNKLKCYNGTTWNDLF